jgi:DNA mismatch repair protein MutL
MGKIRLLTDEVASQVAAGEVVERPASIVKELVENSIDAGAKKIIVEFARGGIQCIRVIDDGCGMDREDALMSLERHATSKIRSAGDLVTVATMGFRGEALPSIASVSRFRLVTRSSESGVGTEIQTTGTKIEAVTESGAPLGTAIEVRGLFFNVPARKKFLRGEETESAHIIHQMHALALAHPSVGMLLQRDGKCLWQAAATSDLGVRIRDIFGLDFMSRLMPLEPSRENDIEISGFLAKPGEGRPDREQQFVVLNNRVVQCPAIFQALREAYAEALPKGRHPIGILRVTMDPLAFDCNVHPAKREVRLHRPDLLRQCVYLAARNALEKYAGPATISRPSSPLPSNNWEDPNHSPQTVFSGQPQMELPVTPQEKERHSHESLDFRLIGGVGANWILMEGAEGLVMVDARAASERILFESLRKQATGAGVASQKLLLPSVFELTVKDAVWISENLEALRLVGFVLEPFGGTSFKIESVPACISSEEFRSALLEICESLRSTGLLGSGQSVVDSLIRSVSRLAASNGFQYHETGPERLVRDLLKCELPYACPQGRPTMIQWSFAELDRKFGR